MAREMLKEMRGFLFELQKMRLDLLNSFMTKQAGRDLESVEQLALLQDKFNNEVIERIEALEALEALALMKKVSSYAD